VEWSGTVAETLKAYVPLGVERVFNILQPLRREPAHGNQIACERPCVPPPIGFLSRVIDLAASLESGVRFAKSHGVRPGKVSEPWMWYHNIVMPGRWFLIVAN